MDTHILETKVHFLNAYIARTIVVYFVEICQESGNDFLAGRADRQTLRSNMYIPEADQGVQDCKINHNLPIAAILRVIIFKMTTHFIAVSWMDVTITSCLFLSVLYDNSSGR